MRMALAPVAACLSLLGCFVPEGATPSVDAGALITSQYNFRGMVENEHGALQGDLAVDLPTKDGGTLTVSTFGNMDLSDSTGDAWFPDGHGGRFSEIDLTAAYSRQFDGVDVRAGVESYILPNGLEFPNGERGETKEVFAFIGGEVIEVYPSLTVHYDFDEADGFYVNGGVAKIFDLGENFSLTLEVTQGFTDEDEANWLYGIEESGLADLRGTATASYAFDKNTTFEVGLAGSRIIDSDIRDWFEDQLDIDADNVWVFGGIRWRF